MHVNKRSHIVQSRRVNGADLKVFIANQGDIFGILNGYPWRFKQTPHLNKTDLIFVSPFGMQYFLLIFDNAWHVLALNNLPWSSLMTSLVK